MNKSIILSALLVSSAAAIAQAPADTTKLGARNNPDEIVCVRESQTGSRLGVTRVCRTRAEWAEHRRQYRQATERAQNQSQTDIDG